MGPLQGERTWLGVPDYGFRKIPAIGAGQKKIKKWNQQKPMISMKSFC